jgi:hypothetical protein
LTSKLLLFRLSFSLTLTGELQLCVNSRCVGAHLKDLPVESPLWLIIDIYGSTQAVQVGAIEIPGAVLEEACLKKGIFSADLHPIL